MNMKEIIKICETMEESYGLTIYYDYDILLLQHSFLVESKSNKNLYLKIFHGERDMGTITEELEMACKMIKKLRHYRKNCQRYNGDLNLYLWRYLV